VQTEDETSDEEKQKEIDRRKDEETKLKAKADSKLPSGASSKGTNTPSGRPKHTDPMKKPKTLKRSGSPNLSESSGNESSRKKHKKKHHPSSQPTGTTTPIPGSRPMSPAPTSTSQPAPSQSPRKSSIIKLNLNPSKLSEIQSAPPNPSPVYGGAMSDGEATGGEMSDGGKKKRIKLRLGTSPTGSRAGTPAPGRAGSLGAGGSRAGSPAVQTQSMPSTFLYPTLYLFGYFVGKNLEYSFQERLVLPTAPVPSQVASVRVNPHIAPAMKSAVRSILPEWVADGRPSIQTWLQTRMRYPVYWKRVQSFHMQFLARARATVTSSPSVPVLQSTRTRSVSFSYLSSLHRQLLTQYPSVSASSTAPGPSRAQSPGTGPIQAHEIAAALPASGIAMAALIKLFAGRVGDVKGQQTDKKEFIQLVKENSSYGQDKLLRPK
jgi:hypothetical protein